MDLTQEVLAFSRDYVNGNQTKERKQKIAAVYKSLFGENLRIGCGTCYIEAIFKIKKAMAKEPCSYRLKPGAVLQAFGDESKTCTNENLTNELAEFHLRVNPGCAKFFSVLPPPQKELEIVDPKTNAGVDETKTIILNQDQITKIPAKESKAKRPSKAKK